jgi:hypothetical protein
MPSSADRLLQFVIEHEGCGQEAEVGSLDRDHEVDIVLRYPGCSAGVTITVTVAEAEALWRIAVATSPRTTFCGLWHT